MSFLRALLCCSVNCLVIATLALAAKAQDGIPPELREELRAAGIGVSGVSLYAQEFGADKAFISFQALQTMNPASVMKLLTTYAALELLGPNYVWKTEIYGSRVVGDALQGDLYIKGYGDPKFTMEQYWLLLRSLRQRGVREISGDLVLDNTYFAVDERDPSEFDNQGHRAYNVIPRPFVPSFHAVSFRFVPDAADGVVRIFAEPDLKEVRIINQVALRNSVCPNDWRESIVRDVSNGAKSAVVRFTGSFSADCGERDLGYAVLAPREFALALFKQYWSELGGSFRGAVREGAVPAGAKLLASRQSPPLGDLVREINKWSNNVMARQLLLSIGAQLNGAPGTVTKGRNAIEAWLALKGLRFPELVMENGAGLSRADRLSAQHVVELLLLAARSPYYAELRASLPLVGMDGTMKRRLESSPLTGQAHVKTGSLEGVRTIAGYLLDQKGRSVAFAFFINHSKAHLAKHAQDALLRWLHARQ